MIPSATSGSRIFEELVAGGDEKHRYQIERRGTNSLAVEEHGCAGGQKVDTADDAILV
jgi:hypothetical protein